MSISRTVYERISISGAGEKYNKLSEKLMEYLSSFDNATMLQELNLWFLKLDVDSKSSEITDINVETGNYYYASIDQQNNLLAFPMSKDLSLFSNAKDLNALIKRIPSAKTVSVELSYHIDHFLTGYFASDYWKMVIDQFDQDVSDVLSYSSLEESDEDDTIMFEYTSTNKGKPVPTTKSNFAQSVLWRADLMYFILNISSRIEKADKYINEVSAILKGYSDKYPEHNFSFDISSDNDGVELYFNKEGETYSEAEVYELIEAFSKASKYIVSLADYSEDCITYNYYMGLKPSEFDSANAIIIEEAYDENKPSIQYYSY